MIETSALLLLTIFIQDCIRITHSSPLLLGDRFFDFVCTLCTGTCEEVLRRLDLTLTDALHLALFNLTVMNSKKYHNIESSVIPFIRTKWKSLQGKNQYLTVVFAIVLITSTDQ